MILNVLAQSSSSDEGSAAAVILLAAIFTFMILTWVAAWKVFTKADEAGWKALIPIWNVIVLMRIVGRPWWWVLLLLIPIVGWVVMILVILDLSKSFGHGVAFALGLLFLSPIFLLVLGFGEATYRGPAGPERRPI